MNNISNSENNTLKFILENQNLNYSKVTPVSSINESNNQNQQNQQDTFNKSKINFDEWTKKYKEPNIYTKIPLEKRKYHNRKRNKIAKKSRMKNRRK